jgi:hypothetical protein
LQIPSASAAASSAEDADAWVNACRLKCYITMQQLTEAQRMYTDHVTDELTTLTVANEDDDNGEWW